jgi:hypothetical protein
MAQNGGILTFDLGKKSAFAYGFPQELPIWGKINFGEELATEGDLLLSLARWTDELIFRFHPTHICTETPWLPTRGKMQSGALRIVRMDAIVQMVTRKHRLRFHSWSVKTVSKFFLGDGSLTSDAKKAATQETCLRYGWKATQDECDTLALWCYAESVLDPTSRRAVGLFIEKI